jgi:predicted ATPase/DNA-binding CsgD family transcriptional regulator
VAADLSLLSLQPTPLLGRGVELETIEQRLVHGAVRLLSLTGPAGVGKTRLAVEAGARLAAHFPDGVSLVDLSPVREPGRVLPALAQGIGLTDPGTRPLRERLQEYLQDREMLLILDNFEQVLAAAGELAELLAVVPQLKILVTSRVPLHLRWEQTLRIVPLAVPDLDSALPLDDLLLIPAVALLVDRARAQRADFVVSTEQAPLLVQLARQLDGLPLAIELAAANMNVLPLAIVARRLEQRLQALRWDAHDLPDRHRSLQAAIGWSYDLLPPSEQRLFRHLGVFVGQVSLDAIETVAGDESEEQTLDGMVALAEKSLVLPGRLEDDHPEPTFRMLETVRQFACEQLEKHRELEAARRAHAQYFLDLGEKADPRLRRGGQQAWYLRLEAEHNNVRAALRWLLDNQETEPALRLAGALAYFWWLRGYHAEALQWLEEGLKLAPDADPAVRTRALLRAGLLLNYRGDLQRSKAVLDEALALAEARHDRADIAQSLTFLGLRSIFAGELEEGGRILRDALRQAEALAVDHQITGLAHSACGFLASVQGNFQEATAHDLAALASFLALGNQASATITRFHLALILPQSDDLRRAVQFLQEGLQTSAALQNRWLLRLGVEATVLLAGEGVDTEGRARLLGAGDMLVRATGSLYGNMERVSGRSAAGLRAQLGQQKLAAAYREGRSLQFREIVALALDLLEGFSQPYTASETAPRENASQSPLSPRETEVLQLVADGLTSKQIGNQLFLSPKTVNHHLTSVFNKLGVDSRAQAVAVATRRGFL